jgi:hypothetical protein
MKKLMTIIVALLLIAGLYNPLMAQKWKKNRQYITIHLGASNFLGDLGGSKDIGSYGLKDFDVQSTRGIFGAGYSYRFTERFNVKGNFYFGWIGGDDTWTSQINRNVRNLHFRSILAELSAQAELYLTLQNTGKSWGRKKNNRIPVSTYLFAGVGGIYFDPKGKYLDGKWYSLQPLHTEGQGLVETRTPYSRFALTIPFGIGLKYDINRKYSLGFEYGMRWTNSDYIDDVSTTYVDPTAIRAAYGDVAAYFSNPADISDVGIYNQTKAGQQRGNPMNNDNYMFANFTLYINLYKSTANICSFQY